MHPRASISRTKFPFATPPAAGLQDIFPIISKLRVTNAVSQPIRALTEAASQPACPAPITITSKSSSKLSFIFLYRRLKIFEREHLRRLFHLLSHQGIAKPDITL